MSYPSSVLNTNIASMIAQRNLAGAQQSLATSVERLSSGLRINRAKDDASGMAVATVINSQIKTSGVAYRNVNDAISMMQTAEGAMQEAGSMLLRIKELVTQGSNDSMSREQYFFLVQEMAQLMGELANTAGRTSFNGNNLLGNFSTTGSVATKNLAVSGLPSTGRTGPWTFMTGAGINDRVTVELVPIFDSAESSASVNNNKGYVDGALKAGALNALYTRVAWLADPKNSPDDGNGYRVFSRPPGTSETATMLTQKVYGEKNTLKLGTTLAVGTGSSLGVGTGLPPGQYTNIPLTRLTNGSHVETGTFADIVVGTGGSISKATVSQSNSPLGISLTVSASATVGVVNGTYRNIPLTETVGSNQVETGALATIVVSGGNITSATVTQSLAKFGTSTSTLQLDTVKYLGATSNSNPPTFTVTDVSKGETLSIDAEAVFGVSGGTISLSFESKNVDATGLIDARNLSLNDLIDDALMQINAHRSYFGAFYGRFEHNIANLSAQTENLSAALSRVQDADYGAETATLTKVQILQQAATAMLAQANAMPNVILGLLKSG